jgi:carboxylesterase type B
MVWIYGGDLSSGAISAFDGTSMAANQDVVVVMMNYRVNGMSHSRYSLCLPT